LLELTLGIAEGGAGADEHSSAVTVGAAAHRGLREHSSHGVTDERWTLKAEPIDRHFEICRKLLEIHLVDGRPRTIARKVERNRMQACALESRDLRRPSTGRTADPM
jgi:hypothetical protein